MNYGKAHTQFQPNVLCNEVQMKLYLHLTLLFVFSINSGPCGNINGGLLNESRQAPMNHPKSWIDNKYPPEIMNNDQAIINGTQAQLNRPFIKQTHTHVHFTVLINLAEKIPPLHKKNTAVHLFRIIVNFLFCPVPIRFSSEIFTHFL